MGQHEGRAPEPATTSAGELYIYYKVAPAQRAGVAAAVLNLLTRCRELGVSARLMRRRDVADDGSQTWMEVYGDAPPDFEHVLARLVAETGLASMTSERHHEWFVAF